MDVFSEFLQLNIWTGERKSEIIFFFLIHNNKVFFSKYYMKTFKVREGSQRTTPVRLVHLAPENVLLFPAI